ncbi:hypothetical protein Tco_1365639 [Tanacetum coccineum]
MPDDEVSIYGFEADDSNEKGTENTESKINLTQSEEATADNILDELTAFKASANSLLDPLVKDNLEESVPRMVAGAFEERMP